MGDIYSEAELERLGRMRPTIFPNLLSELGFCFSLVLSQIMAEYFISGFNVLLPSLAEGLDIPEASSSWPSSAFALTAGGSLLFFGRLADRYGGFVVFAGGLAWHLVWSLVAGFAKNALMMYFCRALQGFGPAAFLSAGIMLLGTTYRPGWRKNLVFSIYGACAPIGFVAGIFVSGMTGQFLDWRWYFWIGTMLLFLALIAAVLSVPASIRRKPPHPDMSIDWAGAGLFFCSLVLIFFAINDCGHAPDGWRTPYVYVTLIVGFFVLLAALYVEGWVAKEPLLPLSLFRIPQLSSLLLGLFCFYGVFGIWLLYCVEYMENIMHASPLLVVAYFVPFALGGIFFSLIGGLFLHVLPGTVLLVISGIGWLMAPLLFAIMPLGASYWPYVFPAMICGTLGMDVTYNVTNIFVTTSLPERQQGLAAAVANSVLFLGISFWLGWGDFTSAQVHGDLRARYQAALWMAVGLAGLGLIIMVLFVKIKPAKSEVTVDEKEGGSAGSAGSGGSGDTELMPKQETDIGVNGRDGNDLQ
ncbi:uncharacterized protein AKAW2_20006S [Aspergillus luchuensis]|uniref:Drug resistance protein n=2 Tax=Aspergillus kawachii TaxID=1069201 RepID=A0A146F2F3_ASPKA|nr:uncharacterized protein AKAW2_20006S [Aspergillus luchuensis]OJZ80618.1 hypothetical protein ASPFODRAFT_147333 [Aspergillus luchuensis CBS 106.47]GAA89765.1 drug resistance protein [Aspergillus luchuensis IFO 4308]BCR95066.1 hypothetical protein AKAW2_20006S [Aspergillus luchuensis]BCS07636.1 hypothetical protein ALUC_20006S [Aspergillus luchuensis]GAT20328.1 drug resistance protein [Aspergillus luchuensis]